MKIIISGVLKFGAFCALRATLVALVGLLFVGCAATIHEKHHFASYDTGPNASPDPVNFFRLSVDGRTHMSSARYVAGYYDERAVDLFFNEIRASDTYDSTLFGDDLTNPGSNEKIVPLSPAQENGAFVIILSTDADSVANTIGSFAEAEATANAITNMLSRDTLARKATVDAQAAVISRQAAALDTQLQALISAAQSANTSTEAVAGYLRVLNLIARAEGFSGSFASFSEARVWFDAQTR